MSGRLLGDAAGRTGAGPATERHRGGAPPGSTGSAWPSGGTPGTPSTTPKPVHEHREGTGRVLPVAAPQAPTTPP